MFHRNLVASDMFICIETCVCYEGTLDRLANHFWEITSFSSQFKFEIEAAFTIWDSLQTGGSWERDICKRNSKMLWKNRLHGALRKTSGCLQFCNWEIRDFRHFWSKKFAAFFFSQIHHKWGPAPGMQNPMVKTTKWGPPFLQRSVNVHAFAKY